MSADRLDALSNAVAQTIEVVGFQSAFEIGTRVHTRRSVTLDVHGVAGLPVVLAAEEPVETDFVERR